MCSAHWFFLSRLPQMSSWIIAVLLIVFGGLLSFSHLQHAWRVKTRSNGRPLPPGPPGLPIIGHLHMLGNLPHRSLQRLADKYGPIMYIRLGLKPTIVVSSPQAAELILKTHDNVFANRPNFIAAEYFDYGNKGILFSQYGSYWRNMRKLCTIQLLSHSKIDSFKTMRREEIGYFVHSIKDAAKAGAIVNLSVKVGKLIEDMVYQMVVGSGSKDEVFNLKPIIQEGMILAGAFNLADYIPFIGVLDPQGLVRRMKVVSRALDEFLEKIIDRHTREANKKQDHMDFIDVMLSLIDSKDAQDGQPYMIDRTNIKAISTDIIAGAIDTSATAIEWALAELLRNKRVMKLLQEELERVVGMDRMVEEADLEKLEYLDIVVKESMRLHPVGTFLFHECMEDIEINGYYIPKNARVLVNTWAIGRDPAAWSSNAEEFYPERFMGTNIDLRGRDFQLIPFGSGRRSCPGMHLGLTAVQLVLAQLLHCFDWELPNGMSPDDLDMIEKYGLASPRSNHLLAIPTCRLHVK